ncbi:prolipoprotein diacylglyceryl transferase, partial [Candidatus Kuenenbacteria bacterium CG22_combo_CG10-13_8_21_14_all_39_9]
YYQQNPVDIFKIWQGGLAIHGALIAGILVIYFFKKINRLLLLDIFAPLVALGLALGRWGNYFNQELYGRPTDLPWGIPINLFNRLPDYQSFEFFQPIFLYESLWCLLLFGLLIYFHNLRFRKSPVQKSIVTLLHCYIVKNYGAIFFIFLILYSLERFLIGFLRVDPQASWFALRLDQWVSLLLIIIPVVLFIFLRKKQKIC